MADKNIIMQQKDNSGTYNKLYPKTTATQSKLTAETAELFGDNITDADAAMRVVANVIKSIGNVQVKVVDGAGNPIENARIIGITGSPYTNSDGLAQGIAQSENITVQSPFAELQNVTTNVKSYIGSLSTATIILPTQADGYIVRYTSSQNIKFSKMTKTVDICCVGGGGGGSGGYGHGPKSGSTSWVNNSWIGKGGGGGNIVNKNGITISSDTNYSLIIGSGGGGSSTYVYTATYYGEQKANVAGDGGTTSFLGVEASGGTGGSTSSGTSNNGGSGNSGNSSGTEFNDNATYYSGGGGNGTSSYNRYSGFVAGPKGGSPYGGYGGCYDTSGGTSSAKVVVGGNGLGIGGGGGGGTGGSDEYSYTLQRLSNGGNGGSGLVAIRFHF